MSSGREIPWLRRAAATRPRHPALVHRGGSVTYAELEAETQQLAARLRALGVERGERVAVLMGTSPELVSLIHSLTSLGAVFVPLNLRLVPAELRGLLVQVRPRLLICDGPLVDLARRLGSTLENTAVFSTAELAALPPLAPPPDREISLADDHSILFTSGTTGRAKGVRLSVANQLASAKASAARLGVDPRDQWLACVPLYHIAGLSIVLRSAIYGTTLALHAEFDANEVAKAIQQNGLTLVSLVPTMLGRVLDALAGVGVGRDLRCALIGGGPISSALLERARSAGLPVAPTYGLTEAASQVATARPGELNRGNPQPDASAPVCVGRPLPGTKLRIVDETGRSRPAGKPGEILVSGPQVMAGYLDLPEETRAAVRDGWLYTGDVGAVDAEGRLSVFDRRLDLVVSGGENVYPSEVEATLLAHPEIADAAVVGRPDEEWGQRVHACVVRVRGSSLSAEGILAHCRSRLASFKLPRAVEFHSSLPRTSSGKLRRDQLRRSSS